MKKTLICIALVISLASGALPAIAAPAAAKDYLNIGNGFYNNEKYAEAIKNYDLGLKLEPKNTVILLKKADALYELLKFSDMSAVCDIVIGINGSIQGYYKKGLALMALGKRDDAIKMFDTVISKDPKYPGVYKNKANVLRLNSKFQDALACLDKALEQNPKDGEMYATKGECFLEMGQYQDSVAAFLKYLELNPEGDFIYLYKLGAAYYKQNDLQNCFLYLRKAMAHTYGADMKLEKDPLFSGLENNTEFLEIIHDQKSFLEALYSKVKIFDDPIFDTVSFLAGSNASDSDKSTINSVKDSYNNNLFSGNIYNEATATQYNLCANAVQRAEEINYGRFVRRMALVGLKVTLFVDSYQILYVGKTNGALKAAVIQINGHTQLDGIDSKPYQDIYLYVQNNGVWQNYGLMN